MQVCLIFGTPSEKAHEKTPRGKLNHRSWGYLTGTWSKSVDKNTPWRKSWLLVFACHQMTHLRWVTCKFMFTGQPRLVGRSIVNGRARLAGFFVNQACPETFPYSFNVLAGSSGWESLAPSRIPSFPLASCFGERLWLLIWSPRSRCRKSRSWSLSRGCHSPSAPESFSSLILQESPFTSNIPKYLHLPSAMRLIPSNFR